MDLFDESVSQRIGEREPTESYFEFVPRHPLFAPIRIWMAHAFQSIPVAEQKVIKQRLTKDRSSVGFVGAYFEMQIHQLLLRQGTSPEFRASQQGPDLRFLEGEQAYGVECTVLHGDLLPNEDECVKGLFDKSLLAALEENDLYLIYKTSGILEGNVPSKTTNQFVKKMVTTHPLARRSPRKERFGWPREDCIRGFAWFAGSWRYGSRLGRTVRFGSSPTPSV